MKLFLNILLLSFGILSFYSCASVPQHTVSHLGDSGERFGSAAADIPFDQQGELTSSIGSSQPDNEPETAAENRFDQQNEMDIGIIFMPVSIQNGLIITDRMLRFCERLYRSPCTHLRVQAGQAYGFPRAPVSLPGESYRSPEN